MVQTTKFFLIYQEDDMDYKQFCSAMFEIQNQIRSFKNRASSEYFSILMRQIQFKEENGRYPTDDELVGCNIRTHFYRRAIEQIRDLNRGGCSAVSEDVCKYIKTWKKDILSGKMTIPSYRIGQPIIFTAKGIRVIENEGKLFLELSVFANDASKRYGLKGNGKRTFEIWHKCKSSIDIVSRCLTGDYKVCESSMSYNKKKKMWEFALSYKFEPNKHELNQDKILGIDLGIAIPVVAAISDSEKRWFFNGHEIDSFRMKTEAMRRQMSKARVQAGNGSVGHGRNSRCKPVDRIGNRIANFRNSKNDAWSREIVNIAVKNGCGTIQMEDLSGISSGSAPMFLKNWTYYDLQNKIKYKAEAEGIQVVLIDPQYTSQRCSRCGYIATENRMTQSDFVCKECGYTENADYNAARNIATKDIVKIIKNSAKVKCVENTV